MSQKNYITILIDELSNFCSENIPIERQEEAINHLSQIISDEDLYKLIQPKGKAYWENAAKILVKIGFPRLSKVEDNLMYWLQDLNWPGANNIYKLFLDLDNKIFLPILRKALRNADNENDTMWLYWLNMLVEEKQIRSLLENEYQKILDKREA